MVHVSPRFSTSQRGAVFRFSLVAGKSVRTHDSDLQEQVGLVGMLGSMSLGSLVVGYFFLTGYIGVKYACASKHSYEIPQETKCSMRQRLGYQCSVLCLIPVIWRRSRSVAGTVKTPWKGGDL